MNQNRLVGVSEDSLERRREEIGFVKDVLVEKNVQKVVCGGGLIWELPQWAKPALMGELCLHPPDLDMVYVTRLVRLSGSWELY